MPQPLSSADLKELHRYITTDPAKTAKSHRSKAEQYEAAAYISILATLAITGGTLAMFLGFFGTAPISFGAVCLSLGGAAVTFLSAGFFIMLQRTEQLYEKWNELLDLSLEKIEHWTEKDVVQFYRDNHCSVKNIPAETRAMLKQMNPEHPLLAMIPLIARYQLTAEKAKWMSKAMDQIHKKIAEINRLPLPQKERKKLLEEQEQLASTYELKTHICSTENLQCVKFTGLPNKIPLLQVLHVILKTLKNHAAIQI